MDLNRTRSFYLKHLKKKRIFNKFQGKMIGVHAALHIRSVISFATWFYVQ
jgi:hypothetical protein